MVLPIFQKPGSFSHQLVLNPRSPTPCCPCSHRKGDIPTSPLLLTAVHTSTVLWGWQTWNLIGHAQWRTKGLAGLGCESGMWGSPQAVSWEQELCSGAEQSFPLPSSGQDLLYTAWPRSRAALQHPHCPGSSALTFSTNPKPGWKLLLGGLRVCFTLNHPHAELSILKGKAQPPISGTPFQ